MVEVMENLPLSSLSLDECRRDSPQFRHALSESEKELTILQNRYADSATACRRMVDDGKQFFKSMRIFVDSLDTLKPCFADNDKVQDGASKCLKILCEFREQGIFLLDRFSEAEMKLLSFHQELKKLSETKRYFERASEDLDDSLSRSLGAVIRLKQPVDFEETDNMTDACRKSFLHVSIDYVRQIRNLRLMKNSHILETMLRVTDSGLREYHHQGWDFMNRVSIWSEHIRQQIEFARVQAEEERKRMDSWQRSVFCPVSSPALGKDGAATAKTDNNGAVDSVAAPAEAVRPDAANKDSPDGQVQSQASAADDSKESEVRPRAPKLALLPRQGSSNSGVRMCGYLFRKTSKKLAKTWVRRWFVLTNNHLQYCKRSEPNDWHTLEQDLRLCTAKPNDPQEAPCRRFCFQIISPERSHSLQAESSEEMKLWVDVLQAGLSSSMNTMRRSSTPAVPSTASKTESGGLRKFSESFRGSLHSSGSSSHAAPNLSFLSTGPTGTLTGSAENRFKKEYRANKDRASRTIRALPGNETCAECGADTKWASVNLGITLCLECSGGHRSLGVHLSKVKSLFLDEWGPEPLRVMTSLGNVVVNRIFEGTYHLAEPPAASQMPKLKPMSTREMRDTWIRAKWLERRFVAPITIEEVTDLLTQWHKRLQQQQQSQEPQPSPQPQEQTEQVQQAIEDQGSSAQGSTCESDSTAPESPVTAVASGPSKPTDADSISSGVSGAIVFDEPIEQLAADLVQLSPNLLLHRSARMRCLPLMLCALAHGAKVNWADPADLARTPLHRAVQSGSLAACECLLLNGAKVVQDAEGRSPLHLACLLQHKFQVTLFTKRSDIALHARDKDGQEPLDLALGTGNADIVTILRMLALNEASGEDGFGGDETVNDIFRDFRNRAYLEEDCDRDVKTVWHSGDNNSSDC